MTRFSPKVFQLFLTLVILHLVTGSPLVLTPVGQIRGKTETAPNNKTYISFRNIPYAKPPLGELRFAKPEPHPGFEDTFEATGEIVQCIQPSYFLIDEDVGSEDCLILNIFLKEFSSSPKKVLFYIHGGGFLAGSSKFLNPGTFVTDHDVIVVTINYRVGILGFLSSLNEASLGNYGLWDQALALNWTKKNIASFGGDSNDITVGGLSGGAASAAFMAMSPLTKDLFTKAYYQSGSPTSLYTQATNPKLDFSTLAKSADCWEGDVNEEIDIDNATKIVQCLRNLNATDFSTLHPLSFEKVSFTPVIDGDFLPKHPTKLLLDDANLQSVGMFNKRHLVVLNNNDNGPIGAYVNSIKIFIYNNKDLTYQQKEALLDSFTTNTLGNALKFRLGTENIPNTLIDKVYDWYEARVGNDVEAEIVGDLYFAIPVFDFLNAMTRRHSSTSWLLYFNYYPKFLTRQQKGMLHNLDLVYWMDYPLLEIDKILAAGVVDEFSDEDVKLKNMFSSVLAQFMKTGKLDQTVRTWNVKEWPRFNSQCDKFLNFNLRPSVQRHLENDKRYFWKETVPQWAAELESQRDLTHSDL